MGIFSYKIVPMRGFLPILIPLVVVLSSCSPPKGETMSTAGSTPVGYIVKNCDRLVGKEVFLDGVVYAGWSCPGNYCRNPGVTRSDTCVEDETGCIYLKGTAGLDPLRDRGVKIRLRGVVKETPRGVCYIEVRKVERF